MTNTRTDLIGTKYFGDYFGLHDGGSDKNIGADLLGMNMFINNSELSNRNLLYG